jgi:hypothetical protein
MTSDAVGAKLRCRHCRAFLTVFLDVPRLFFFELRPRLRSNAFVFIRRDRYDPKHPTSCAHNGVNTARLESLIPRRRPLATPPIFGLWENLQLLCEAVHTHVVGGTILCRRSDELVNLGNMRRGLRK